MPTLLELRQQREKVAAAEKAAIARALSHSTVSTSPPFAHAKHTLPADLVKPQSKERPDEYPSVESRALSTFDDNPLFGSYEAAQILAISVDLLKKWRLRDKGPDYVQYGPGGPVRYELEALTAFRARHRVKVSAKL